MSDNIITPKENTVMKRYILGRAVKSRTYLADSNRNKLYFDMENFHSREYSLIGVVMAFAAMMLGLLFVMLSLKKGMARKKTIRLQKKEIKRLEKLCADTDLR